MTNFNYSAPSSKQLAAKQNEPGALRLLLAQRLLYTKAKRWQSFGWVGVLVIGVAAPVISFIWPAAAVGAGALSGVWLFLGRTLFVWLRMRLVRKAAAVQESFDHYVFGMPASVHRSSMPSPEDIEELVLKQGDFNRTIKKEKLLDWYPISEERDGTVSIAIAQRANAAYSDRLLRLTFKLWAGLTGLWVAVLIAITLIVDLSLTEFLLGVFLPILPACLDVFDFLRSMYVAARERRDLSSTIQMRIEDAGSSLDPSELQAWQSSLYDLRLSTPAVPDWLYKLKRKHNEEVMSASARELAEKVNGVK